MALLSLTGADGAAFERDGLVGPFPLLSAEERAQVIRDAQVVSRLASWYRGLHVFDTSILTLGCRPDVATAASSLVGPDLLLWGCELAQRVPGVGHHWHSDVEARSGRALNVWVGLEHLGPQAPFLFVPGSHRYGTMPQDLFPPDEPELRDDEVLLGLARRFDPDATVRALTVPLGEVVLFDGDLWHGTRNDGTRMRKALVLQYCLTSTQARRPLSYETPVQWHPDPVQCALVTGTDDFGLNPVVEGRTPSAFARLAGRAVGITEHIHDLTRRTRRRLNV